MKRICTLICVMVITLAMLAPACFAATEKTSNASAKTALELVNSSPEDGTEGVAVDNLSIKIKFNKDVKPSSDKIRALNKKQFKLKSEDGTKIPIQVYYSDEETGLILVAADVVNSSKNQVIKSNKKYILTINRNFTATDGTKLSQVDTISVKTLNQQQSTIIYMVMMFLMMGGMIFFMVRSQKKEKEKEEEEKNGKKKEGVNPYKEAKKTGKTVAEVVESEKKKKTKREIAEQKHQEELAKLEEQIKEEIRKAHNKHVPGPRPISAAGSNYKVVVKTTKDTTETKNSKNSSNSKKKHKKK